MPNAFDGVIAAASFRASVKTAGGDAAVPTVSAVRKVFQRAIDENLGDLNMTTVVKLFENEH